MSRSGPLEAIRRRREARARVSLVEVPQSEAEPGGAVTTEQAADVTLPREQLEGIWSPEYLERLARTYWRFLSRVSLGLIRVLYTDTSREVVLIYRPLVLLRFHKPEYEYDDERGQVTWPIEKGLLVAPSGRGKGYLRITVRRPPEAERQGDRVTGRVSSEVASFYPMIAGWGWFAKVGAQIYRFTQLKIHVIVTNAFLRSLARLDLAPSRVGSLATESTAEAPDREEEEAGTPSG